MKTKKRFLSILLSLALVLGLLPGMSLTAYAATYTNGSSVSVKNLQSNDVLESGVVISMSGGACYRHIDGSLAGTIYNNASWTTDKKYKVDSCTNDDLIWTIKLLTVVEPHNITITGGANATTSGGATSQTGLTGAMTTVTYTANSNYQFPATSSYYTTTNGITVARTSDTVVTVSGTPTADATITVPDAEKIPSYTVTYKVVNGTWSDDSTTDKTETVQSGSTPASVPTGMKAASGYTGGEWDTDPAEATITGATTFTYTFTAIPTYTVTYKVVNGTWSDDNTTDKTETVRSGSTPASVPTGMKAASGYTGGAWDTDPTNATITGATTFTYTFTAKQAATVTIAPEAKTLTYTGQPQALITAGTAEGGEMQYALGNATEATQPYTTSIPTATDAGTYYVWYKVVGDENHLDTKPVMLKAVIENVDQGEAEIKTEVRKDENSPKLETSDLTKEVAESSLTDKEKAIIDEAVNDGKDVDVDVYLAIRDYADEITAEDKAKLEAEASNAGQLAYFDISLFKEIIVDGSSLGATSIHELQKPLKLTIGVPKSFPAVETGYTRTYAVLRLHEGKVTTLPATVNADGTISFETDRFSVYALVYKDIKDATTTEATTATTTEAATATTTAAASTSDATTAASAKAAAEDKTAPKTGDSMPIAVLVVLMLSAAGMLVFMDLKKKKN